ncbi:glycosyltransferase family 2 protein [Methylobacterium gossipiicola]|uniref:Glycosyltransferase involved in cell wall bisynthesis n=1 Tax=Methylobacterium gossipiicola TaxID=582675 RepID=A0A1I2WR86_9HYPH|nr:glycosyltransferase family 2 protein [Methylobacterium gossipiicola]SFH03900.1 Glycosyltransferase involved in cell wall bisynthesis [Methylobacterium gossipiicola]
MRLVMTLLIRNEIDIIADWLTYHLAQGVDFIIVTDNGSTDGTLDVVARFVPTGRVCLLIEEDQDYRQYAWVTRMAGLARDLFKADWIINSDADEFWHAEGGSLKAVLETAAADVLMVRRRNMIPPEDGRPFLADGTLAVLEPVADRSRSKLIRTVSAKAVCRGPGFVAIGQGNHAATYDRPVSRADEPRLTIYHYPVRSYAQFEAKVIQGGAAYARNTEFDSGVGGHWRRWYATWQAGGLRAEYDAIVLSPKERGTALAEGILGYDDAIARLFRARGDGVPAAEADRMADLIALDGPLPADFDAAGYLRLHPDLAALFSAPWQGCLHYLEHGRREGRIYPSNRTRSEEKGAQAGRIVLAIDGLDGSGKSAVARHVAAALGATVLDPFAGRIGALMVHLARLGQYDRADAVAHDAVALSLAEAPPGPVVLDRHWFTASQLLSSAYRAGWEPRPFSVMTWADRPTTLARLTARGVPDAEAQMTDDRIDTYRRLAAELGLPLLDTTHTTPEEAAAWVLARMAEGASA